MCQPMKPKVISVKFHQIPLDGVDQLVHILKNFPGINYIHCNRTSSTASASLITIGKVGVKLNVLS